MISGISYARMKSSVTAQARPTRLKALRNAANLKQTYRFIVRKGSFFSSFKKEFPEMNGSKVIKLSFIPNDSRESRDQIGQHLHLILCSAGIDS